MPDAKTSLETYEAVEVLLVEDSPEDAEMTMRSFKKRNLTNQIHHVEDGAEALDYLFGEGNYAQRNVQNKPKVVVLDLKLPKLNGLEVLKRMKADDRTKSIPVVVMTSSKEDKDVEEAYKLGVNSYVVKPVDFSQFMDAVSQLGMYWLLLNQKPEL